MKMRDLFPQPFYELAGIVVVKIGTRQVGVVYFFWCAVLGLQIPREHQCCELLTFDFDRTPPVLSIQMYSAMTDPF